MRGQNGADITLPKLGPKIVSVPLSDDAENNRVADIENDILSQLIIRI